MQLLLCATWLTHCCSESVEKLLDRYSLAAGGTRLYNAFRHGCRRSQGRLCLQESNPLRERPEDTAKHCFMAAFAVVFFRDVLGLSDDDPRLSFQSEITAPNGALVPLDWPLGAMVAHSFRVEQWSPSVRGRGARIGGIRELGGRLPLQVVEPADEPQVIPPAVPVVAADGHSEPNAVPDSVGVSAVVMWALLWIALAAAVLWAIRCALLPLLVARGSHQGRVIDTALAFPGTSRFLRGCICVP